MFTRNSRKLTNTANKGLHDLARQSSIVRRVQSRKEDLDMCSGWKELWCIISLGFPFSLPPI
jgi:hypothetical protein